MNAPGDFRLPDGRRLGDAIESITRRSLADLERASGSDIGQCWRATLSSGERVCVKHYPDAPPAAVTREAAGLRWLAEPDALPIAQVRGVDEGARLLLLDWIDHGAPTRAGDEAFGRGLAALHAHGAESFGAVADNFIGPLPQPNAPHPTWAEFYATERIAPLVRRACDRGLIDVHDVARADRLSAQLDRLFAPEEPPSRLHGDLWGGNRLCDPSGRSWLIDPAAHAGHREMDLAMMQLFGGFSDAVFSAYSDILPLAAGAADRVPLCQLYPLLVHVILFGAAYVGGVRRVLDRFA